MESCVSVFSWDLFDNTNHYMQNDTIKLDIKIGMADPDEQDKSELVLEETGKSCAEGCSTTYRLTVSKIENLMAVRSAPFTLRKEPWHFLVLKNPQSGQLGIRLDCKSASKTFPCDVKMSIKLVSMKSDGNSIEQEKIQQRMTRLDKMVIYNFVSWDELRNPNNGFVNNNSIVIEVEIKSQMSGGMMSSATKRKATRPSAIEAKRFELACKICSKRFENQSVSTTNCGHLFCTGCITNEIAAHKECPTCKTGLCRSQVRRAHLPL